MLKVSPGTVETFGSSDLVERLANMLVNTGVIRADAPRDQLLMMVASLVSEAQGRQICTERLIGMYVLLVCSDGIDPFEHDQMRAIITDRQLAEDDRAHLLQMLRLSLAGEGR